MNAPTLATGKAEFPHGLNNAYFFAGFNALSFQVVLGSPMVLYAKSLGASATVLGIITGMMPLLVIFQIPAAQHVSRIGYKRFVYAGWGTRVMFIFVMALVPLTWFLNETTRLVLLLTLLFGFNLSRGISSAGWLPWITSLVPAAVRGKYLSRDAGWTSLASFGSFQLSALGLGTNPHSWQFSILILFSGLMGATSLFFLKRIPEAASEEAPVAKPDSSALPVDRSTQSTTEGPATMGASTLPTPTEAPARPSAAQTPVPWLAMLKYPPFLRLLWMVVAWSIAYGGLSAFTVVYLKYQVGLTEGATLRFTSLFFLGGLFSLFLGTRLDRLGSKPVLTFSFAAWLLILAGWALLAGKSWEPSLGVIALLQFLMGFCAVLVNMSNTRLAMAIVPPMGRNHFFAIFSVLGSVALGLAPILWGLLLDAIGPWQRMAGGLEWNRYTIFFGAVAVIMLLTLVLSRNLHEPEAASLEELLREILIQTPQRVWVRLWPRE